MITTAVSPVFVGGAERTGTSLMYALLTSHPNISMTRRTNFWRYIDHNYGDLDDLANLDDCLDVLQRYKRFAPLEIDWIRLREEFLSGEATYARLFHLIEYQYASAVGKRRWGDKSLYNERYADRIFDAFPDARIIHMLRDPRDRYASVLTRWETRRGGVGAGMAEWMASVRHAESNLTKWPSKCMIVRYEDLVTDPEASMRDVCAFIGENFSDEMMSMQGAERFRQQGSNSSYGRREAGSISASSVGRHAEVLSSNHVRYMERVAAGMMMRHGYLAKEESMSTMDKLQLAALLPLEEIRRKAWQSRSAYRSNRQRPIPGYRLLETIGT